MQKEITQENIGTLCICAMRYAMGRQTYMPSLVCEIVEGIIDEFSNKDLVIMERDIIQAGDAINTDGKNGEYWLHLLHKIQERIYKNGLQ